MVKAKSKETPILIHYGAKMFMPEKFKPVENRAWVKPLGGLWTSPIGSDYEWKDTGFKLCDESNCFTVCLKMDAKVFMIDSLEDLMNAPLMWGDYGIPRKVLDFEAIAEQYDAIWLTGKGLGETHDSFPTNLFGWDCESVLILNADCISTTC